MNKVGYISKNENVELKLVFIFMYMLRQAFYLYILR